MRYGTYLLGIVVAAAIAACVMPPPAGPPPAGPPPAAPPPARPVAVDNGQPKMQATLQALGSAQHELQVAWHNKGGHRVAALQLIQQAMAEVQAGIAYANAHPHEVGAARGPSAPEPVDAVVPGAEHQPHMAKALVDLREAHKQLQQAGGDKGGHRVRALALIGQAQAQVRQGIRAGNKR